MRRIVLSLALAGVVAGAAACSKNHPGAVAGPGASGVATHAGPSVLDLMPEDTAVIGGVNVTKLISSRLWEQYGTLLLIDPEVKEAIAKVKDTCGIDLTRDIHSVVFGMNGDLDEQKVVIVVKGAFDEPKVTRCLVALAAQESGVTLVARTDGPAGKKITQYLQQGENNAYLGWASADTFVIIPSALEGDKAVLEAVLSRKSSARNNPALAAIMRHLDTAETGWAAMLVPASGKLKDSMGGTAGPKPEALWLNLAYQKELALEIGARFPSESDALDQVGKANRQLADARTDPAMGPYLKNVKAEASGPDAILTADLSEQQVDELVTALKRLLPALMKGM